MFDLSIKLLDRVAERIREDQKNGVLGVNTYVLKLNGEEMEFDILVSHGIICTHDVKAAIAQTARQKIVS